MKYVKALLTSDIVFCRPLGHVQDDVKQRNHDASQRFQQGQCARATEVEEPTMGLPVLDKRERGRDLIGKLPALAILAAFCVVAPTWLQPQKTVMAASISEYHLLTRRTLGGEGFWDYLAIDGAARRLYISRWSHVMVVDADTYRVVGDIPGIQGVHGIAIASEYGRGFITEDEANQVTIFDLKTLKKIGTTKTGQGPDAIIYDAASKRVFTFNGGSGNATAIDARTGVVAGNIDLGGDPEFAAADGQGHIYDNLEDKSEVLQIDSKTLKILNRWPLAPGESPSGMAIDRAHRRLFIGCHNKMMVVMDADTGKVVETTAIGEGVDANRFDPGTQLAFSSNGDGTLTIVREDTPGTYTVVSNVRTRRGARTMELDGKTHRVYLVTAELGPQPQTPHTPPPMTPGTFTLLVYGQK
jgi:DNA-binding beta-propeller fold protein YncE